MWFSLIQKKLQDDLDEMPPLSLSGDPIVSDEETLSQEGSSESESTEGEYQDDSTKNDDTQWISATDYFERRRIEHLKTEQLLSRLSVNSPNSPQEEFLVL